MKRVKIIKSVVCHRTGIVPLPVCSDCPYFRGMYLKDGTVACISHTLECKRCGRSWKPRVASPRVCPYCKSPYWNLDRGQPKGPRRYQGIQSRVEPPKQNPPCIYCGGENVIKGGWIPRRHGDIQRYICKDCRRTFIPREEENHD